MQHRPGVTLEVENDDNKCFYCGNEDFTSKRVDTEYVMEFYFHHCCSKCNSEWNYSPFFGEIYYLLDEELDQKRQLTKKS
ncbi:hypothetical protein AAFX13_00275 [Vibrio parahaemolyticus]|uniref:hypothetical protein n=1 Tax=Vibrio parahaemolyticus TaxID=670 RepID=UPI00397F1553